MTSNKKFWTILFSTIFTLTVSSFNCEIIIKADKNQYNLNDFAIIEVTLIQTHGNCYREGSAPAYRLSGLRLIKKYKFKKIDYNTWIIKYKVKILKRQAYFISYRRCPRGGDEIKINFKITN